MTVESSFPIITTPDLDRALGFYRDVLGGTVGYAFPPEGPPAFVALTFGTSEVGLAHDPAVAGGADQRNALWMYTDDCDGLVATVRTAGGTVVAGPNDEPWGERVAHLTDPDGNRVIIGQRLG